MRSQSASPLRSLGPLSPAGFFLDQLFACAATQFPSFFEPRRGQKLGISNATRSRSPLEIFATKKIENDFYFVLWSFRTLVSFAKSR